MIGLFDTLPPHHYAFQGCGDGKFQKKKLEKKAKKEKRKKYKTEIKEIKKEIKRIQA